MGAVFLLTAHLSEFHNGNIGQFIHTKILYTSCKVNFMLNKTINHHLLKHYLTEKDYNILSNQLPKMIILILWMFLSKSLITHFHYQTYPQMSFTIAITARCLY